MQRGIDLITARAVSPCGGKLLHKIRTDITTEWYIVVANQIYWHISCARSLTAVNLQWRSKKTSFGLLVLEDNIIRLSMPCTLENSSSGLLFVAPLWPSVFDRSANGASGRVQLHHASH